MTETREFNGSSVDEAVQKAAATFGVDGADLSYEVVDAGSSGFMGIGARDARIVVEMPADFASSTTAEEPSPEDPGPEVPGTSAPQDAYEIQDLEEEDLDGEDGEVISSPPSPLEQTPDPESDEPPVPEEVLDYVRRFTSSAVEGMGIEARVDVYDAGDFVAVDVTSEQAGLFIGQKGETIDALQYLLNVATHKEYTSVKKRAVLDAEGYRQRRIEALQGMAHRSARRAIRERRRIELPPMNPSERRIVHLYLQENDRVTTASEGTGDSRRVTVSPL